MSVQDIYNKLRTAPQYHPASAELFDDMTIEAGDVISVQSDSEHYSLPVFAQHLVWNGAAMVTVQSQGEQERKPLPALQRRLFAGGRGSYKKQKDVETLFKRFNMYVTDTDELFSRLATESEWDELSQTAHVTAWSQITQTARELTTVVEKTGIDGLAAGETLHSEIVQQAGSISTLVRKTGINSMGQNENLYSMVTQNAEEITQKVAKGSVISTINQSAEAVTIQASKINLEGYVTASQLSAVQADITNLTTGTTVATYLRGYTGRFDTLEGLFGGHYYQLKQGSMNVCSGVGSSGVIMIGSNTNVSLDHYHNISASESGGVVTLTLGKARSTAGSANFNIADTQFYKDGVSAARNGVTLSGSWGSPTTNYYNTLTVTASNGKTVSSTLYLTVNAWTSGSRYAYIRTGSSTGTYRARLQVSMPDSGTFSGEAATGTQYGIPVDVSFVAGGKTYTGRIVI